MAVSFSPEWWRMLSRLLHTMGWCSGNFCFRRKILLSNKPLMSLSLLPEPFFSLEAGQLQHLLGYSPTIDKPAQETPGSTEMSGNKAREWKTVGVRVTATWMESCAADYHKNVFLFRKANAILLTSEPFQFKSSSSWLIWLHEDS